MGGGGVLHPRGKTTLKTSMVRMFVYVSHVTLRATGWSARRFLLFLLYVDQLPLPPTLFSVPVAIQLSPRRWETHYNRPLTIPLR